MRRYAAVLMVTSVVVAACGNDIDSYCGAVAEHQAELVAVVDSAGPDAVFAALPVYRDLSEQAPPDLRDEWSLVVERLVQLQAAFEAAGVQPADYDPQNPPAGITDEHRLAIEKAARKLGAADTQDAMAGVEQQARDVCQTELGGEPATE